MRKMMLVSMSILLVFSASTYADISSQPINTGDQLVLTGDDKNERYQIAQATDSTQATLAALSKTEYEGRINGWDVTVAPYFWLAAMDVTTTIDGISADVDLSFSDILDDFDVVTVSTHTEAWKENKGIIFDFAYLELTTDEDIMAFNFDINLTDIQIMLGGAYLILDEDTGDDDKNPVTVDVRGGLRYHYLKQKIKVTGPLPKTTIGTSKDWLEPWFGSHVKVGLSEKWSWGLTGDVGGFGIGSASDLTWELISGFEYMFNDRFAGRFGYKYYDIDYSNGSGSSEFGIDGNMDGVYLALAIGF